MAQQNHEVSIVSFGDLNHRTTELLFRATMAAIPHTVFKLSIAERFQLKSSAVVILDTAISLKVFNKQTILPQALSM